MSGKLHVEISKLGGSFMDRYADINEDNEDESPIERRPAPMIVRVSEGFTVESCYVKLGLLKFLVKSKFLWGPVLNLVLFNLLYFSYLKFWCVEISGISK